MKKHLFFLILMLFAVSFVFISCNDDDKEPTTGTTRVEVRLTDAPAPYDAVYINIQSISLHLNTGGWQEVTLLKPGVYNLLDFRNGIDTLLAGDEIPSGKISQIRLVLGTDSNSVVVDGQDYPLTTPSGQESGLKLNLHDELFPDVTYRLWIDFDAARSIVKTGSGKYILKPVIRTYTEAFGGSLKGTVLPQEANTTVLAILGTDTVSTYPEDNGYFLISGLQPNSSWKVVLDAGNATPYQDSTVTNIAIVKGQVTNMGQITLHQ